MSENKRRTPARRILRGTANIVFPVTESGWVIRAVRHMLNGHRRRLHDALPETGEEQEHKKNAAPQLSWAQAVAASGMSVPQLTGRYTRLRRRWRVAFTILLTLATLLGGMALHATALPPLTLLRLLITLGCLLACCGYCTTRALTATYRLWQLREKRVSEEESGTFRDFLTAQGGWGRALRHAVMQGKRN